MLISLVAKFLVNEDDFYCTLAVLSSMPSPDVYRDKNVPQNHVEDDSFSSGDMQIDSAAEVNQTSTDDGGLPGSLPFAEE